MFQGKDHLLVVGTPPPPPKPEIPPPAPSLPPKIELKEKIQFETARADIKSVSFNMLNDLAEMLKKTPRIRKIAIEGHSSAEGSATVNLKLSDERAKSVAKYLEDHGVEAGRLTAKGYGVTRPVADNKTEEGREKNRRVEITIVEQDGAAAQ